MEARSMSGQGVGVLPSTVRLGRKNGEEATSNDRCVEWDLHSWKRILAPLVRRVVQMCT